ncbi:hypothetical protein [Aliiroseovarius lamellibrachiae]|uniref:hypothetical protein n=1 Tax=Aliiroseovarius lamellibrachiae TaxID=1924933 RepID=UPI001BDF9E19|nr:hypothetical protein [Aliiroseovarius lamellibrachiae]MBT2130386.1 hypothetical protein [Aliiroseovarius lamellibrachiae]
MTLHRAFWGVFVAAMAIYLTMLFWTLPGISAQAGGLFPFDMRPGGYTFEDAQSFLAALTEQGRALYLGPQHVLDLLYPGLLMLTLILGYFLLFSKRWAIGLSVAAGLAALFDWSENAKVAELLKTDLAIITPEQVASASLLTVLKSGTVTLCMSALLVGAGLALFKRIKRKRT